MSLSPANGLRAFALVALFALAAAALPAARSSAQTAAAQQPPSPNGKIVFQSDQAGDPGVYDIYAMDAEGRHETRLTNNVAADDVNPAWSPDGTQIAFISLTGSGVYAVNAGGGSPTLLNGDEGTKLNLFWSPDGSRVAFTNGNGVGFTDVFVVNADGTSRRPLNYTKTRRADETARSWQRVATP